MSKQVDLPMSVTRNNVILIASISFAIYAILFFIFKAFGLLHLSGLRMLNYIILGFVLCYQTGMLANKGGGYLTFLQAFAIAFFTGTISYILFAAFVFLYSLSDPYFSELYFNAPDGTLKLVPFIILFFEGSAGSVIVGLIVAMYSEKYRKVDDIPRKG